MKVLPPVGYVASKQGYDNLLSGQSDFPIHSPIRQMADGISGVWRVIAVKSGNRLSIKQFLAMNSKHEASRSMKEQKLRNEHAYGALQRCYWAGLGIQEPLYGSDSPGSLFDTEVQEWNLAKLPSLLPVIPHEIGGVTSAMLYFGQWKSTFAW